MQGFVDLGAHFGCIRTALGHAEYVELVPIGGGRVGQLFFELFHDAGATLLQDPDSESSRDGGEGVLRVLRIRDRISVGSETVISGNNGALFGAELVEIFPGLLAELVAGGYDHAAEEVHIADHSVARGLVA